MKLPRRKTLIENARNLRKGMTKEESHLWYDFLQNYPLRFRRQEIVGDYIADFFCDKAKLIVEIDGSQHYEDNAIAYDNNRTEFFNNLGIHVLRVTNSDVKRKFQEVCIYIDHHVRERCSHPSVGIADSSP